MKQFASGHLECIYFLHMLLNGSDVCFPFYRRTPYGKIDVRFYKKRFLRFLLTARLLRYF